MKCIEALPKIRVCWRPQLRHDPGQHLKIEVCGTVSVRMEKVSVLSIGNSAFHFLDLVREVLQPFVFANFQPVHAPNLSPPASHASGKQSRWAVPRRAFKNGAGTASSPRLVSGTAFYGD